MKSQEEIQAKIDAHKEELDCNRICLEEAKDIAEKAYYTEDRVRILIRIETLRWILNK